MNQSDARVVAQALLVQIAEQGRPMLLPSLEDQVTLRRKHARLILPVMLGFALAVLGLGWMLSAMRGAMSAAMLLASGLALFGAMRAFVMPRQEGAFVAKTRESYAKLGLDDQGGAVFEREVAEAGLTPSGLRAFDPFKDTSSASGGDSDAGGD